MSSPLEFLDQQEAERAKELKKLSQTPCYDHTQCGEDCLPDCPHYVERKPEEKAKPAYKYGLEISEPQKRLWVGEVINGSVYRCLYSDTWDSIRMIGTREKTIENAKLIVKALNLFDDSVDAPYCHDLEQRIELLEMQLEEAQAKAEAYDRLMSGGLKTIIKTIKEFISTIPDSDVWWCPNCGETECSADGRCVNCGLYIDTPDIEAEKIKNTFTLLLDSLTLPDGWEEK